jgi:hypothetical protein
MLLQGRAGHRVLSDIIRHQAAREMRAPWRSKDAPFANGGSLSAAPLQRRYDGQAPTLGVTVTPPAAQDVARPAPPCAPMV